MTEPTVTGVRQIYNDGKDDFFSYRSTDLRANSSIKKVIAGELRVLELSFSDGQVVVVERRGDDISVVPLPNPYRRYKDGPRRKLSELEPAGPESVEPITIATISEGLRARRIPDLLEANNRYQQEGRDARAEVEVLRQIIRDSAAALGNGSFIGAGVSTEFLKEFPGEVAAFARRGAQHVATISKMDQDRTRLGDALLSAGIGAYTVGEEDEAVKRLAAKLQRATEAARYAGCVESDDGQSWACPARANNDPPSGFTIGSWETPEGGIIRLEKWPDDEGYVLWYHGEIRWRSNGVAKAGSGDFSIGSTMFSGAGKAVEEMGELLQVIGKLIGSRGDPNHFDGSNLLKRLEEECPDAIAAIAWFARHAGLDRNAMSERDKAKSDLFDRWHKGESTARLPRCVIWQSVARMTDTERMITRRESAVLIRTENGIWRTRTASGGGSGYTTDTGAADTWSGEEALNQLAGLGPEKEACIGFIIGDATPVSALDAGA